MKFKVLSLFSRSILAKVSLIVVLTSTITLGLVGLWEYKSTRDKMESALNERAERLAERLALSFMKIVWGYENKLAESVIHSEMREASISGILVWEEGEATPLYGGWRSKNGNIVSAGAPPPDVNFVERDHVILRNGMPIGAVRVFLTRRYLMAALNVEMRSILTRVALLDFVIVILLTILIRKFLTRPLSKLHNAMAGMQEGELDQSLAVESTDEIGQIAESFNIMAEQLRVREKALRESEKKYRDIFENAVEGILQVTSGGEIISVNPAGARILGYDTPNEVVSGIYDIGKQLYVDPTRRDELLRLVERLDIVSEFEAQFYKKDRSKIWISISARPVRNAVGEFISTEGFLTDITERKRAEEEMTRLRNLLRNIVNSMPSVLVGVDREGTVNQWNREAEKATGVAAGEAQGRMLTHVFPQLEEQMEKVRKAIRDGRTLKDENIATLMAGEKRFSDMTIYPLMANGVEGAVIRVDDVTDRVQMEEMMIQSEKMLSVGGLAAGMAHEINNPLAGMMQTADVMAGRLGNNLHIPANRKAAEAAGTTLTAIESFMKARGIPRMLSTISESGKRVAAIVDNMLSFARKSDANVSSHALDELLDKTLELAATDYDLKKQYDFKRIEILRDYGGDLPIVPCEAAKIQQVLLNLFRNGAQAMQEAGTGSPRFTVRTRFEKERNRVRMEIEDNGPGMDEATRKRVFEPFFTTKPTGVGTGLGLSVSYFIITENHRGEMAVVSGPGSGAKFIIRLPI